jgi:carboxymethylenebutenolidase
MSQQSFRMPTTALALAYPMSLGVHERYEQDSQRAIDSGVFGAPTYVANGEMFWGQDRLDFLERRLARG